MIRFPKCGISPAVFFEPALSLSQLATSPGERVTEMEINSVVQRVIKSGRNGSKKERAV